MSYTVAIRELITSMYEKYDKIQSGKKKILNDRKIIEYLFYKPILSRNNLLDAIKVVDDDLRPVWLSSEYAESIVLLFLRAFGSMEKYQIYYYDFLKVTQKHISKTKSKVNFNKNVPLRPNISLNMVKISNILHELKLGHYYTMNWSFKHDEDEHFNLTSVKPYIFDIDLRVDFFGCIFVRIEDLLYQMIMFAIEYDSDSKIIIRDDYLKQYYLRQMNVHLLRLNSSMDFAAEIKRFTSIIKISKTYVIANGLITRNIPDVADSLQHFFRNYKYNHDLFMKYFEPCKHRNLNIPDEVNVIYEYRDEAPDEGTVVPPDFFKKLKQNNTNGTMTDDSDDDDNNDDGNDNDDDNDDNDNVVDFDLNDFLETHKPIRIDLSPYLNLKVLKGYHWIKYDRYRKYLEPDRTHIKYIKGGDEFKNKRSEDIEDDEFIDELEDEICEDYIYSEDVIRNGGLLLAGGHFFEGSRKFTKSDKNKWTHLQLLRDIPLEMDNGRLSYLQYITIKDNNIFFKYVRNKDRFEYAVELVKSKD